MKETIQLIISTDSWYSEPTYYWYGDPKFIKSAQRHLEDLIRTGRVKKIYYQK